MISLLTGKGGIPPAVVAAVRGLVEAVALAALSAAVVYFTSIEFHPNWAWLAPAALLAARSIEGVLDQIDPFKVRANELQGRAIVQPAASVNVDDLVERAAAAAAAAVVAELNPATPPADTVQSVPAIGAEEPDHEHQAELPARIASMPPQGPLEELPASAYPPGAQPLPPVHAGAMPEAAGGWSAAAVTIDDADGRRIRTISGAPPTTAGEVPPQLRDI